VRAAEAGRAAGRVGVLRAAAAGRAVAGRLGRDHARAGRAEAGDTAAVPGRGHGRDPDRWGARYAVRRRAEVSGSSSRGAAEDSGVLGAAPRAAGNVNGEENDDKEAGEEEGEEGAQAGEAWRPGEGGRQGPAEAGRADAEVTGAAGAGAGPQ